MARRVMNEAELVASDVRVQALVDLPGVAAIIDRTVRLTGEERIRLHAEWMRHYRIYRPAQGELWNRCVKTWGDNWRDVLTAKERVRLTERAGLDPHEGDSWGASYAVQDAATAVLFAHLLKPGEVVVYAGPWRAVVME